MIITPSNYIALHEIRGEFVKKNVKLLLNFKNTKNLPRYRTNPFVWSSLKIFYQNIVTTETN